MPFSLNERLLMTAKDPKHPVKCPFWSTGSKKCGIAKDGLFIPLDDHVEAFCKTSHFSACSQYTLYSENQICLLERVRKCEENRRKYMRIATSHDITLVKIFKSKRLKSQISYRAKMIDVSKEGLRMAIKEPLIHDMMVHCSFDDSDDSFPQGLHEVIGRVEWCNKQIDEPGYQAGLSINGDDILEAMGGHLGKQNKQK